MSVMSLMRQNRENFGVKLAIALRLFRKRDKVSTNLALLGVSWSAVHGVVMIDTDNDKVLLLALVRSRPGEAAAAPEERRPNCLLMSTGEHHRCLKFDSAPQINPQPCSTSKCFTVTAQHLRRSSAPNKNGRHP